MTAKVPHHLRLLRGNPGKRRLNPPPAFDCGAECPPPPEFLPVGHATDEWFRVGPELHRLGLLSVADIGAFSAYCRAFGQWAAIQEAISKLSDLVVPAPGGRARAHPLCCATPRQPA